MVCVYMRVLLLCYFTARLKANHIKDSTTRKKERWEEVKKEREENEASENGRAGIPRGEIVLWRMDPAMILRAIHAFYHRHIHAVDVS